MRSGDESRLARLAEPLRSRLHALLEQAGGDVWITSGRRSTEEQVQLRREHCGTSSYDIWQRPASECSPPTAIPGRSEHNRGLAADLGGDLALAGRLGHRFGLSRPVPGEEWHFEADDDIRGMDIPGPIDVDLPIPDGIPGAGALEDAVRSALGTVLSTILEPTLAGLRRVVLWGLFVGGGVTLVAMGGIRGTTSTRRRR